MTSRTCSRAARAALLVVALSCLPACRKEGGAGPAGAGPHAPPPTPVEVAAVEPQIVRDIFRAVGTVQARDAVVVASEIDGRIVELPFTEGERVGEGQVLARLDDVQIRAEVARAQALLTHARTESKRSESLVEQEILPSQARDATKADLGVAQADAALGQARLSKTVIRAPFAGLVGSRRVSPGAYVRAGEAITDLSAIDTVKVVFAAPERVMASLAPGVPVTITTPAFPGASLSGEVSVVDPIVDQATRSARVTAVAPNPDLTFRPGMSATIGVLLAERSDALTVPNEAIFVEGTQSLLYVIGADGSVHRQPVEVGTRLADVVEVLSGLKAGDRVVRTGHQKLYEGAKVMAVEEGAGAPAAGGAAGR